MSAAPKSLLVLGTGSHVGKSLVVAGLCRILAGKGLRVAPFKAQNMALNSGVTADGGEIGRAQCLQARAAGVAPRVEMNPVLLKPLRGRGSQVVLLGRARGFMTTKQYYRFWPKAAAVAGRAYRGLAQEHDFMLLEGAGSPAEVNLAHRDLANLETARFSKAPWILVADIERGGSFASIVGTLQLVPAWLRRRFKGVVINKFRGDISLLKPGLRWLEKDRKVPVLGVIPSLPGHGLEEEDSLGVPDKQLERKKKKTIKIEIIQLAHLSNFNDMLPLQSLPGVTVAWRRPGQESPWQVPDLIILPGTKATLADLWELQRQGEARRIRRLALGYGSWVVGLCGGYQMLGKQIEDLGGHDSPGAKLGRGLALLDASTSMRAAKSLSQTRAKAAFTFGRYEVKGYEIHQGSTQVGRGSTACFSAGRSACLGARSRSGRVWGTYLHGIFENDSFRRGFLAALCKDRGLDPRLAQGPDYGGGLEARLDAWAGHLAAHLDLKRLFSGTSAATLV